MTIRLESAQHAIRRDLTIEKPVRRAVPESGVLSSLSSKTTTYPRAGGPSGLQIGPAMQSDLKEDAN